MAILDSEFYDSPGFHSTKEEQIEQMVGEYLEDKEQPIPPEIYDYVSPLRKLLFEWYPFRPGSRVLEIGGNMGELTEFFCQKSSLVVTLEATASRRKIIKKRCRNYRNLEIKDTNIQDIPSLGKFDYIIIHNLFGFLKKYYATRNTYVDFLTLIYSSLSPAGRIFIAVNNRIGIKYLSGAIEEHTRKMYVGVNAFDGYDRVRTFSKMELIQLFEESKIANYKFYYPFPNYVFPVEIHTSESLKMFDYGEEDFATDYETPQLFDKRRLSRTLRAEGCMELFVNSFLIELSHAETSDILFYKPRLDQAAHREGFRITGSNLAGAVIEDIRLDGINSGGRTPYSAHSYSFEPEKVKICLGSTGSLPSQSRWKEALFQMMDECVLRGATYDLCDTICGYWSRISRALRRLKEDKILSSANPGWRGISQSIFPLEQIFFLEDGQICILCPIDTLQMGSENIEYLIWKLLYGWYGSQVLPFQSFQKYISVKSLYKACDIDFQMTEIYKKRALQEAAFPSDKSELQSYSRDVYDIGVSEAAHILAKGTPVIRDHQPQQLDGRQERLLYEEKLLDTIRRERCMQ